MLFSTFKDVLLMIELLWNDLFNAFGIFIILFPSSA